MPMTCQNARFLSDTCFWLALMAGPVVWLLLWLAGLPTGQQHASASTWLYVVMAYPVLEEIIFRGGLQNLLLKRNAFRRTLGSLPITLANVTTTVIFAAFHLLNQPPLWAVLVIPPSLIFGWMRERHDSVAPSILLHVFYNAGFVALFASG